MVNYYVVPPLCMYVCISAALYFFNSSIHFFNKKTLVSLMHVVSLLHMQSLLKLFQMFLFFSRNTVFQLFSDVSPARGGSALLHPKNGGPGSSCTPKNRLAAASSAAHSAAARRRPRQEDAGRCGRCSGRMWVHE